MKKILIIVACALCVTTTFAKNLHCPTQVYYNGVKMIVEDKEGNWDMFSYPADLKPGYYYFSYAKAYRTNPPKQMLAECGYDVAGKYPSSSSIRILGPKAAPLAGNWHARTAEEWFCTHLSCSFDA